MEGFRLLDRSGYRSGSWSRQSQGRVRVTVCLDPLLLERLDPLLLGVSSAVWVQVIWFNSAIIALFCMAQQCEVH